MSQRLTSALLVLFFAAALHAAPRASIDATIRGTDQPLSLELLVRAGDDAWKTVAHRALDTTTRRMRFDALEPGIYQLLIKGQQPTERLATKIVLGSKDNRSIAIDIEPIDVAGRITYAGTEIGGVLLLRNKEFQWRAGIAVAEDGTFRAPMWQRGEYTYEVRGPALTTPFHDHVDLAGTSPLAIDIPDGRIRGVVREKNDGAFVARAAVVLEGESLTRMFTDAEGRFDFTGVKDGPYTVSVVSPAHLDREPIAVQIDGANRLRELAVDLERGRDLSLTVVDQDDAPVVDAFVFVTTGTKVCSRTITDGEGHTNVAAPASEPATLFIVPRTGPFAVVRVAKRHSGALQVHLGPASSSLHIRTQTLNGAEIPPFSLLMRYNGTVVPLEIADALAVRGLILAKGTATDVRLENIPIGSYEFWPYRTSEEAEAILSTADDVAAPIHVDVRAGENNVAVQFAAR